MFTNQNSDPTSVAQSEPPTRQRYPIPPELRPTTVRNRASKGGNLFGGWGPRLG